MYVRLPGTVGSFRNFVFWYLIKYGLHTINSLKILNVLLIRYLAVVLTHCSLLYVIYQNVLIKFSFKLVKDH